jgi:hypothetical protein
LSVITAATRTPDVLLLDVALPGIPGETFWTACAPPMPTAHHPDVGQPRPEPRAHPPSKGAYDYREAVQPDAAQAGGEVKAALAFQH